MKTTIIIGLVLFASINLSAQNSNKEDLEKQLKNLADKIKMIQSENIKLKIDIGNLNLKITNANAKLDSIQKLTEINNNAINKTSKELGLKISTTETNTNQKINDVDESLSKTSLYGIISVLSAILLSGLLYWLLNKRQKTDKTDFIEQLSKTKSSLEESLINEFGKQTNLLESNLIQIEQQNRSATIKNPDEVPDHSLALKVADELTLIERNISFMDTGTRGLKQLNRSVERIKDNLAANGYEIPVLLGMTFNQGMKIIPVNTIPDENLAAGVEIISKIIKPQVNFKDKMIQAAQIEVSVGY